MRIAQTYRRMFPEVCYAAPGLPSPEKPLRKHRIHVGFISGRMSKLSSVMKDRMGVMKHLDRDKFLISLITFLEPKDQFGEMTSQVVDATYCMQEDDFETVKRRISELKFDIIVFCELSFGPKTYPLAHCRFAPVQITTWGHSDTSGIPTIDYYISTSLYEPEDEEEARSHYSEKLVLHSDLCTYYFRPYDDAIASSFETRLRYFIPADATVYLLIQTPFKITNEFLRCVAEIMKRDTHAYLMMSSHPTDPKMGQNNYATLESLLSFDEIARVRVAPWMKYVEAQNLIYLGDVLLDSYPFGGCNTSIESFYVGKPIVTLPSRFINGRFTLGFYKKMGIMDLVATDFESYVDIAVKVGTDRAYRQEISQRIHDAAYLLFENQRSVEEWNESLESFARPYIQPISLEESFLQALKVWHGQVKRVKAKIFPFNSSLLCMLRDQTFLDIKTTSPHFAVLSKEWKRIGPIFQGAVKQAGFFGCNSFSLGNGSKESLNAEVFVCRYDGFVFRLSVLERIGLNGSNKVFGGLWLNKRYVLSHYPPIKSFSKKEWYGISWRVPSNAYKLLETRYGPDWRQPYDGQWHGILCAHNISYPVALLRIRVDHRERDWVCMFERALKDHSSQEVAILFDLRNGPKGFNDQIHDGHPLVQRIRAFGAKRYGLKAIPVFMLIHDQILQKLAERFPRKRILILSHPTLKPLDAPSGIFEHEVVY